jgi:transcriptional antiterminator RfaH
MTTISETRWYVVQSHPHSERKAVAHLNRQGFDTYLPCYLKRRRHARRVENVIMPLFPNYLFVAFDAAIQRWRCIQSTIGVVKLVCYNDMPATVPFQIVEELKSKEDERGLIPIDRHPPFARGDRIQVKNGVFSSCLGVFQGLSGSERAAILLDLLGRKVRVVIESDDLAAA